jgi:hypothetical protein
MVHVVCLIADPKRIPLSGPAVAILERAFGGATRWLAPDEACELPVDDHAPAEIRVRVEAALSPEPAHVVVVLPAEGRRKGLLVSDMDSTMITVECIDELADYLGVRPEVSAITKRAMDGELDFVAALRARVALLEGVRVSVFDEAFRERVRLMPGARALVRTMRSWGAHGPGLGRLRAVRRTGARRHRLRPGAGQPAGEPERSSERAPARPDPRPAQQARAASAADAGAAAAT